MKYQRRKELWGIIQLYNDVPDGAFLSLMEERYGITVDTIADIVEHHPEAPECFCYHCQEKKDSKNATPTPTQ